VRIINGLAPHYYKGEITGKVFVNGIDNAGREIHEIAGDVGTLFQDPEHQLYMKTVCAELDVAARFLFKFEREKMAKELMHNFNLDELAMRHPQSLSGGQKQRLVIVCGLIRNPDILILDEPTSGLDGMNMKTMSKMMKEFAAQGKCVLVITHDLELIAEACSYQISLPLKAPSIY